MWPYGLLSKMDFSMLQAVTYTAMVVISRKRCKNRVVVTVAH